MAVLHCKQCSEDFQLGHVNPDHPDTCARCVTTIGKSPPEVMALLAISQCASCGLVYGQLVALGKALCNACAKYWAERMEEIPQSIATKKGVVKQLQEVATEVGSTALDILGLASAHQARASDPRLGVIRGANSVNLNSNLLKAHAAKKASSSLGVGRDILIERAMKKKDAKLKTNVRIDASLYQLLAAKQKGKRGKAVRTMSEVSQVHISAVFDVATSTAEAWQHLLLEARELFEKVHPDAYQLETSMISTYAHETAKKYYFITLSQICQGTVGDFLELFRTQRWISDAMYTRREVEIRLVFNEEDVFPNAAQDDGDDEDADNGEESDTSFTLRPSRKRKNSEAAAGPSSRRSRVLKSAFKTPTFSPPPAPVRWSRNPPMRPFTFTKYKQQRSPTGHVSFIPCTEPDTIYLAGDWGDGVQLARSGKPDFSKGYIGGGFSKWTIYARYNGEEYAFLTHRPGFDETDVERNHRAEFGLLHTCESFKGEFDKYAAKCKVPVAPFYFNTKGAILGKLIKDPTEEEDKNTPPYLSFLATRLLPCGPADGGVKKFTGNENDGDAPAHTDKLCMAIHAFAHFSTIYSKGQLVLCDLQGLPDRKGVMCLFDPQCHSTAALEDRSDWDMGPKQIEKYLDHHAKICKKNKVCTALGLRELIAEDESVRGSLPPSSPSQPPKTQPAPPQTPPPAPLRIGFPTPQRPAK